MFILNGNLMKSDKLTSLSVSDLRQLCKNEGHQKYSKMKKKELINLLLTPKNEEESNNYEIEKILQENKKNDLIENNEDNIIYNTDKDIDDLKLITFGKHNCKKYYYVIKVDIEYCGWILQQTTLHEGIQDFKQYLIRNYKKEIPKNLVTCSRLAKYFKINYELLNLIRNLQIHTINYSNNFINELNDISPNIKGCYVDYLIRYLISNEINSQFEDIRSNFILKGGLYMDDYCLDYFKQKLNNNNDDNVRQIITDEMIYNYEKLKTLNADNNDILNVSLCHSLFFGENQSLEYFNYIKDNNINQDNSQLLNYIRTKIENKNNILCNPILGNSNLKISADADLIIDDELIDIKCSKYMIGNNVSDFIQLFIYIALYFVKTGIKCTKITIFNPILGYEKYIILNENMDIYEKIVEILEQRVV